MDQVEATSAAPVGRLTALGYIFERELLPIMYPRPRTGTNHAHSKTHLDQTDQGPNPPAIPKLPLWQVQPDAVRISVVQQTH